VQNIQALAVTYTDIMIQPSWTCKYKGTLCREDSPKNYNYRA